MFEQPTGSGSRIKAPSGEQLHRLLLSTLRPEKRARGHADFHKSSLFLVFLSRARAVLGSLWGGCLHGASHGPYLWLIGSERHFGSCTNSCWLTGTRSKKT
jgi:hypothetical protein